MRDFHDLIAVEISTANGAQHSNSPFRWFYAQFGRIRVQLIGGALLAVAGPAMWQTFVAKLPLWQESAINATLGTGWAFLVGYLIFRKVTSFPGVRATANILPAFLLSYGMTMAYFFALRIEYSRFQFFASFLIALTFFYLVFLLARRAKTPVMDLAMVGDFGRLLKLQSVRWNFVTQPRQISRSVPLVVDLRADLDPEWEREIAHKVLAGGSVHNAKDVFESLSGRVQVDHLAENVFGALAPNLIYGAAKRQIDWLLAAFVLAALAPALIACAVAIKLDSKGPIIFKQRRIGLGGKAFVCWKFRTMFDRRNEAPTAENAITKDNDPRITKVGATLRRFRLDELPQLVNIIRGEMSWIGPRPEAEPLVALYEQNIPFYRYRHIVRPGITGWAQVMQGHVTSVEDIRVKLEYDFFYAKHFSLWLDLLVVARTVNVFFSGRGAR